MDSRDDLSNHDVDISQKRIRPKIRAYLSAINAAPEFIAVFKKGYCSGMAALAIYGLYLESLDETASSPGSQRDDWHWLKKTLKKLSRWDENLASLKPKDRANIERLIAHLEFLQHVSGYMSVSQGDIHKFMEDTLGKKPNLEYTLAGLFSADDFTKEISVMINGWPIKTKLVAQLLKYDRRMILISCGKHTLGLFKNGNKVSLYNANHKPGMQTFSTSDVEILIAAIFAAYKASTNAHSPFGFRIFTHSKPALYPDQANLLAAINGPDSSSSTQTKRIHSAMHIAARIGSTESMRYYISRNAKIDNYSKARRTPLYVAASKGHLNAATLLILMGADINKVCRHRKSPLVRANEKGHMDIVEYMLEKNKEKVFEEEADKSIYSVDNKHLFYAVAEPSRQPELSPANTKNVKK
jgi:hypothetical protein